MNVYSIVRNFIKNKCNICISLVRSFIKNKCSICIVLYDVIVNKGNKQRTRFLIGSFLLLFVVVNLLQMCQAKSIHLRGQKIAADINFQYHSVSFITIGNRNSFDAAVEYPVNNEDETFFSIYGDWLVLDIASDRHHIDNLLLGTLYPECRFDISSLYYRQLFGTRPTETAYERFEFVPVHYQPVTGNDNGSLEGIELYDNRRIHEKGSLTGKNIPWASNQPFLISEEDEHYIYLTDFYASGYQLWKGVSYYHGTSETGEKILILKIEQNKETVYHRFLVSSEVGYKYITVNNLTLWDRDYTDELPRHQYLAHFYDSNIVLKENDKRLLDNRHPFLSDVYLRGVIPYDVLLMRKFIEAYCLDEYQELQLLPEAVYADTVLIISSEIDMLHRFDNVKPYRDFEQLIRKPGFTQNDIFPMKRLIYNDESISAKMRYYGRKLVINPLIDDLEVWHNKQYFTDLGKLHLIRNQVDEYNKSVRLSFWSMGAFNLLVLILTAIVLNAFVVAYSRKEIAWLITHCPEYHPAVARFFTKTSPVALFLGFKALWLGMYLAVYCLQLRYLYSYLLSLVIEFVIFFFATYKANGWFIKEFIACKNSLSAILRGN